MLWSKRIIDILYQWTKVDVVYLDATGSILKKSKHSTGPFYVDELVVRNPVATYVTCDHTTASILYFLCAFQTDHEKKKKEDRNNFPVMVICDGSMVLMQTISLVFCQTNLKALLQSCL